MINLLPPSQKQELKDDQLRIKVLWFLIFITLAILFFMAIVFGLNFYGSSQAKSLQQSVIEMEQVIKSQDFQASKQAINATNQNLYKIYQTRNEQTPTFAILEKLTSFVSGNIYLTSFSFQNSFQEIQDPKTKTTAKEFFANVRIEGIAQNRETLFLFKESLSQEPSFKDVYFSPNSWVKPINADFVADLKYFPPK